MPLTVEDGTGVVGADAFVSLAAFKADCDKRGHSYGDDDALIEQAIVRGTSFISEAFTYDGWQVKPRNTSGGGQGLSHPRSGMTDRDGYSVASDSLAPEIVQAAIIATRAELTTTDVLAPTYNASTQVKSTNVKAGPVSSQKEYALSSYGPDSIRPIILRVMDLIGPFLSSRDSSGMFGVAVRA